MKYKIRIILALCILCGALVYLAGPSEESIKACEASTTYSAERCRIELTK